MRIRKAEVKDLEEILKIYAGAREYMHSHGNPTQWPDASYPSRELLEEDIKLGRLFVVAEDNDILAVYAYIIGKDPTYAVIENGSWLNEEEYGTVHRLASSGKKGGLAPFIFDHCLTICENLRGDTHSDNYIMQGICEDFGFKMCGIIHLLNGDPRIAYHVTRKLREEKLSSI